MTRRRKQHHGGTSMLRPQRFDEWLATYFEPYGAVSNPWELLEVSGQLTHWLPVFEAGSDEEIVELFTYTMLSSGTELARFSDRQLGNGLRMLVEDHFCDVPFRVRDGDVDEHQKVRAISSIQILYSDCLARRVKPNLARSSERGDCDALDHICFMLWDVSPFGDWLAYERRPELAQAVLDVLEVALTLDNEAVVMSALHGLGHAVQSQVVPSSRIVGDFIASRQGHFRKPLIDYARAAQTGSVL